jgi:hypothetical protein
MAASMNDGGAKRSNPLSVAVWGTAACLLLLPAVAMQFTTEVNWTGSDFVVMGVMLSLACGAYELATRLSGNGAYRLGAGIAVLAGFLLVWINLAVGIIGSENNSQNLLFVGVLAIGVIGALLARFRAEGMALAMIAMALAQSGIAGFALFVGSEIGLIVLIEIFAAMWLLSAWLFRKAARGQSFAG